jgi:hypothetical protein
MNTYEVVTLAANGIRGARVSMANSKDIHGGTGNADRKVCFGNRLKAKCFTQTNQQGSTRLW